MTRLFDAQEEERNSKRHKLVVRAVEFDMVRSIAEGGATLLGFSVRIEEWECLITLRALRDEDRMVCFVASDSMANAIVKVVRDARSDKLRWREDKYR